MSADILSVSKRSLVLLCAGLILVLTVATADARRRHHRYHGHVIVRVVPPPDSYARFEQFRFDGRNVERDQRRASKRFARRGSEPVDIMALIPRDWRQEPPDPNWNGARFTSPAGDAWLGFYGSPAEEQTRDQHLKTVAFIEGEELTYLRREQDRLVVSGFKAENGDRLFYRKVVLACGGRQWRHFVVEFPAGHRRAFEPLVISLSQAVDYATEDDCGDATVGQR